MMRNQLALGVKGNGSAQRPCSQPSKELAAETAAEEQAQAKRRPINYIDGARRIAFLFREAYKEMGKPQQAKLGDQIEGLLAAETPKTESDAGDGWASWAAMASNLALEANGKSRRSQVYEGNLPSRY